MSTKQPSTTDIPSQRWPEGAIVYQVYPRSFYDSNADGIGDIPGVIAKLDYLKSFGVSAIWLSPFYPSPMADFGYDVADYCDVDPIFGSLKDMEDLIAEAHKRDIHIMVDLVPNHTSDEHEWFRQSKQSREGPYANWYIWHDPKGHDKDGKPIPPNNWIAEFNGESAWEWEPARQQFYLHSFDVHQPDLNWSNPAVRDAIKDAMRFWLKREVDGFRVDAVPYMAKDPQFRDDTINPDYKPGTSHVSEVLLRTHSKWQPHLYAYLAEMSSVLKEPEYLHQERFLVTESYPENHNHVAAYLEFYEGMDPEVAAPFNFEGFSLPWKAESWKKFLHDFHTALASLNPLCVASYAFGNHDQSRLATRLGIPRARAAAVMLLTLPGMAFIYNGEEIGMEDSAIPADMVQDPQAARGDGRDPERTPMQWTPDTNAGFSAAQRTWLPIAKNYKTHNVEIESHDPDSFLSLYRQLGMLRSSSEAIRHGSFEVIETSGPNVLGYTRKHGAEQYVVLINFSDEPTTLPSGFAGQMGNFVLSSDPESTLQGPRKDEIRLRPYEAVVFQLS